MKRWLGLLLLLVLAAPANGMVVLNYAAGQKVVIPITAVSGVGAQGPLGVSHGNVKAQCPVSNSGSEVTINEGGAGFAFEWQSSGWARITFDPTLQSIGSTLGEVCDIWWEGSGAGAGSFATNKTAVQFLPALVGGRYDVSVGAHQSGEAPIGTTGNPTLDDPEVGVLTGLQVDMGQNCPGSPTANTAGDACQAAAQLPAAAAGGAGGVPTADSSNAVGVRQGTGANAVNLSAGAVQVYGYTSPAVGRVTCDITAAGSGTSITIAACLTPESNGITVAAALFEARMIMAYTNSGSPCNVEYQAVMVEDVTAGGVVTAVTQLRQGVTVGGFTATPSTTNCGIAVLQ